MDPSQLVLWGVMSAGVVGFATAYPVNWWLVTKGLKYGMGTERRWQPPFGSMTLLFTRAIGPLAAAHEQFLFVAVAVAGGVLADLLRAQLQPSAERRWALRAFAFLVPVVLFGVYFLALGAADGVSWSIHLWTGAILQAGVAGLLLSYVLVPPAVEDARRA